MKNIIKKTLIVLCVTLCVSLVVFVATDAAAGIGSTITNFLKKGLEKAGKAGIFGGMLLAFIGLNGSGFCWFCSVYEALFDAMNTIASDTAKFLRDPILSIFAVGLMLWIPLHVAKTLTQWQEVDAMQFLQEIMKRFGRALIACAIIFTAMPIFYYILSPLLELTMKLSIDIIEMGDSTGGTIMRWTGSIVGSLADVDGICDTAESALKVERVFSVNMPPFSDGVKYSMLCMLRKVSASLITGILVGAVLSKDAFIDVITGTLPNFSFMLSGSLIMGTYLLIYISFPFKMIDAMVRLTFVAALVPIWVALWVFPATIEYTKNAWNMFIGSCILFLTLSIIMLLIFHIIPEMMPDRDGLWSILLGRLANDQHLGALALVAPTDKNTITTAALGFLCWKLLGSANTLANSFSKAPDLGMGAAMDTNTTKLMSGLAGVSGAAAGGLVMGGAAMAGKGIDHIKASRGIAPTDNKDAKLNQEAKSVALKNYDEVSTEIAQIEAKGSAATPEELAKLPGLRQRQAEVVQNIRRAELNLNQAQDSDLKQYYQNNTTQMNTTRGSRTHEQAMLEDENYRMLYSINTQLRGILNIREEPK